MKNQAALTVIALAALVGVGSAQETDVIVHEGKVELRTDAGRTTVTEGQKATVAAGAEPVVRPTDPMLTHYWDLKSFVQQEKEAQQVPIDLTATMVFDVESRTLCRTTMGLEVPLQVLRNVGKEVYLPETNTFRLGKTTPFGDPEFYDNEGRALEYEWEAMGDGMGYYLVQLAEPLGEDEIMDLTITMATPLDGDFFHQDGSLRYARVNNGASNGLTYARWILPKSAIFVASNTPLVALDSVDGRQAVTVRSYTGEFGDGLIWVAFLWPDADGTSMADLPPRFRGLRGPQDVENAEEFRRQKTRIQAGLEYVDQSTPLRALLSWMSAIESGDAEAYADVSYQALDDFEKRDELIQGFRDDLEADRYWFVENLDYLASPPVPEDPADGYIHPIEVCRPGSLLREDTHALIHHEGKWYRLGNMGNPWDDDISVFERFK